MSASTNACEHTTGTNKPELVSIIRNGVEQTVGVLLLLLLKDCVHVLIYVICGLDL